MKRKCTVVELVLSEATEQRSKRIVCVNYARSGVGDGHIYMYAHRGSRINQRSKGGQITHNAPGSLHAYLDTERTRREGGEAVWEDPEWDECADEEDEDAVLGGIQSEI